MQKIIEQRLDGSEEQANLDAQYTWEKDEIAWYFSPIYRDIFKVKFTGKRWLVGNRWGRDKIYQYEYLESSGNHNLKKQGLNFDGISHGYETSFYTTKEEAFSKGLMCITRDKEDALETFEKDFKKLIQYYSDIIL